MAITKDQIWAAADELDAVGQNPTLAAVRKAVGGGSFTTISEAMAEWKARRAERDTPLREPPPASLTEQITELGFEVWAAALELANGRLASERSSLETARAQLEAEKLEATELADQVVSELETAKSRLETLEASARASADEAGSLRVQLTASSERAATAEARADELTKRVGDLNTELTRLNTRTAELVQTNERLAQERGTLEGIRSKLEAENADLAERTRREILAAGSRISKLEGEAGDLQQQLAAGSARTAAAEAQARELRERLEAAATTSDGQLRDLRDRCGASETAAGKYRDELDGARSDLAKERATGTRAVAQAEQLEKQLQALQREADRLRDQNHQLVTALATSSSQPSGSPPSVPKKK